MQLVTCREAFGAALTVVISSTLVIPQLICDDNVSEAGKRVGTRQTVRELELRIEVMPDSKKIGASLERVGRKGGC